MINRNRHPIRYPGYDYSSSGWYFVTICTYKREHLFGEIVRARRDAPQYMESNAAAVVVGDVWRSLPDHHPVILDAFQIMPNHIHFIIQIIQIQGRSRPTPTLGWIIGIFKSECAKQIHKLSNVIVWQRNYYERIIRNEKELNNTRRYIIENPANWDTDTENITA